MNAWILLSSLWCVIMLMHAMEHPSILSNPPNYYDLLPLDIKQLLIPYILDEQHKTVRENELQNYIVVNHTFGNSKEQNDYAISLMIQLQAADYPSRCLGALTLGTPAAQEIFKTSPEPHRYAYLYLIDAIKENNISRIRTIIQFDKDDPSFVKDAIPLCSKALQYGKTELVTLFLKAGVPINALEIGQTKCPGLVWAAHCGDTIMVQLLLKAGARKDQTDSFKRTALMCAAEQNRCEIVTILLAAGANPLLCDNKGKMAYTIACEQGNYLIKKLLSPNSAL